MPNYSGVRWKDKKTFSKKKKNQVAKNLLHLKEGLSEIPEKKTDKNFLLATWNIKHFTNNRLEETYYYIAEIISSFDIVAVQEIKRDLDALEKLIKILGDNWKYIVSDVTEGDPGNNERMAFIYDTRRVNFTSIVGEIVIPPVAKLDSNGKKIKKNGENVYVPVAQFVRTPYLTSFQAGWFKFYLSTVHIHFGKDKTLNARTKEIRDIALFFKKRARNKNRGADDKDYWDRENYILLGDFNIISRKNKTFKALTDKTDFVIPEQIEKNNLHGTNVKKDRYYDQIVYNEKYGNASILNAGIFDFFNYIYQDNVDTFNGYLPELKAYKQERNGSAPTLSWYKTYWRKNQMSDHLPMWVEFNIDFSERYLNTIREEN